MFHVRDRRGQSLIEVLVGVAIGAMLIAAATFGVAYVVRASRANQNIQTANLISQELLNNVRTIGEADWFNIATSSIMSNTHYFYLPISGYTSTGFVTLGEEGVFDDDPELDNLVFRWAMDEQENLLNKYGEIAILASGYTAGITYATSTSCKIGGCFYFHSESTSSPDFIYPFTRFPGAPVTVSIFLKPEGSATTSTIFDPFVFSGSQYPTYRLFTTPQGGVKTDFYNASGEVLTLTNNAKNIFDNAWHLITITYDDATLRLYIDDVESGVATGSGYFPIASTSESNLFLMGGSYDVGVDGFLNLYSGYMDDFRLYNKVLTREEIQRIIKAFPFTRYFSVSDVCRTTDASSTVVEGIEPPCGSYIVDPTTKKVSIVASWLTSAGETHVTLNDFITRWKNKVFRQTDWVGGAQSEGTVLTEPNDKYASSSGLDITTGGALKLEGF